MRVFSDTQSQRIKLIRCVGVGLILINHISQEYKIDTIAHWTNTGVQMFLVISGFILGQAIDVEWKQWFWKRLRRIIPSYYVILLITAIVYLLILNTNIVGPQYVLHFSTLHFLFFPTYPFWGGHLWYITAITICYAIFPALYASRKLNKTHFLLLYSILVPLFLFVLFYKTGMRYRLSGDIYCFIIGFVGAKVFRQSPPEYLVILTLLFSVLVTLGEYIIIRNESWNILLLQKFVQYEYLAPWKKCLYGLTACLFLYLPIFNKISNNAVVDYIDKYSYEIYLCHFNFMYSPLSVLHISRYCSLNIAIAMTCSLLCAWIVHVSVIKGVSKTRISI
jgi:peptidoglycan/LPS O-acetylase OafA/YrhL